MGSAKKARKGVSEYATMADPTGMTRKLVTGKASARTFLDPKANLDETEEWKKSLTGEKAKEHKKQQEDAKREAESRKKAAVEEITKAGRASAAGKREVLEAKGRDIDTVTSEQIDRGAVSNVVIDPVTGAPVQAAQVQATQVGPAAGVQGTTIEEQQQAQFRAQQAQLGAQLAQRAAGQGMTPAQLQLRQATEENIARQAAARAGMSGAGAALARREAARAGAATAQQGAQQAAVLRAQETAEAQQQQASLAQAARGQDISLASGQAGITAGERSQASTHQQQAMLAQAEITAQARAQESAQQDAAFKQASAQEQQAMLANQEARLRADLANQNIDLDVLKDNAKRKDAASMAEIQSQLQQLGMSDDMISHYMQQELNMTALDVEMITGTQKVQSTEAQAQAARDASAQGGLISAGGALGAAAIMASDENLKKNIKPVDKDDDEFEKKRKKRIGAALKDFQASTKVKDEGEGIGMAGMSIAKAILSGNGDGDGDGDGDDAESETTTASGKETKKNMKAYSDEEGKTNKDIGNRLKQLMDNLDVYDYDYKDEKHGKGRQTSVMAQDLEKSEIGKKAVMETPEGKMVDYAKLLPAMLAANVSSHKRIMKLEDALKAKKKGNK